MRRPNQRLGAIDPRPNYMTLSISLAQKVPSLAFPSLATFPTQAALIARLVLASRHRRSGVVRVERGRPCRTTWVVAVVRRRGGGGEEEEEAAHPDHLREGGGEDGHQGGEGDGPADGLGPPGEGVGALPGRGVVHQAGGQVVRRRGAMEVVRVPHLATMTAVRRSGAM